MDQQRSMERLQREAAQTRRFPAGGEGTPLLSIGGQTPQGVKALLEQRLVIRHFPFLIGRADDGEAGFPKLPRLVLDDRPPYRLSRRHLLVERRGHDLFLVDPGSRSGSLLDGVRLGERAGGDRECPLPPGPHRLRVGDERSDFLFILEVSRDHREYRIEEQVRLDGREIPVALLYGHLCRQTDRVFQTFFGDGVQGLALASELVRSLLAEPGAIDPLYFFSAIPGHHDNMLVPHALNVAIFGVRLARMIPLAEEEIPRFVLAALLHDVGMYQTPTAILNKQETVTPEEFVIIQRHSAEGEARLAGVAGMDPFVPRVALEHHERLDGRGYPRGIKTLSDQVELIALLDFFEAITHRRPQRGPVTPHEGVQLLLALQASLFRPANVKRFLKAFSLFPVYSVVRLNSGEIGQVVATHPDWPLRPRVRICFDRQGQIAEGERTVDLAETPHHYIVQDISDRVFVDHYFKLNPKFPQKG